MTNPLIIGLDLGTSLCKAFAFELDGTVAGSSQKAIKTYRPFPGWAEQDPVEWQEAIIEVLAELVNQLGDDSRRIEAIGLSSHGPCVILTDKNYQPLWRCPTWQDQRSAHLIEPLIQLAGEDWIGLGTPEASFGVQLFWVVKNRPDLINQAAHLFDTKGYLLAFLTGRDVDEPSSSPGGENVNQSLFETLGIDINIMPKSIPSQSIVGNLRPDIQMRVNLPPSVAVVAGLNDGAAATLGAGIVKLGQGIVSLSTNGVMRTTIPDRMPGSTLREKSMFCYSYVDDLFVTGGMTKCGGDSVQWLLDNYYQDHKEDENIYDQISAESSESPVGAKGIFFMPYLIGMGTPNPTKNPLGAFLNLNRQHRRADFTRAILEGTAFALKDIGETFDTLGLPWEDLRFTGGGSKNPAWRQIVADILARPLSGARSDSVLGVALLAATGMGLFPSVNQAVKSMVSQTFYIEPLKENVEIYAHIYEKFKRVKKQLVELSEILF